MTFTFYNHFQILIANTKQITYKPHAAAQTTAEIPMVSKAVVEAQTV